LALLSIGGTLQITELLIGVAAGLTAVEGLSARAELAPGGLLDPGVISRGRMLLPRWAPPLSWAQGAWILCLAGASMTILGVVTATRAISGAGLTGVATAMILLAAALPFGRDGSDEMGIMLSVPVAFACVVGLTGEALTIVLAFVAAQLSLGYFAAGVAKMYGRKWRSGTAIREIAETRSYGSPFVAEALAGRPAITRLAAWSAISWEIAIPFALITGGLVGVIGLAIGAAFHLFNAATMGLNRFLPWFLAAYPAALFMTERHGLIA
jgi:hypothetical protein